MTVNLVDLATELQRVQENKRDYVVKDVDVAAIPVTIREDSEGPDDVKIMLRNDEAGEQVYPLTPFAHGQLADKTGIPWSYYQRMRQAGQGLLLADNVNAWLKGEDARMYRTLDGSVRAVLSKSYKIVDNASVLWVALQEFKARADVKLHKADISETHLYIKAVIETAVAIKPGDMVERGVVIRNSEVGAGAFRVDPYLLRLACINGMIGNAAMRRVHLGRKHDIGEIMSQETHALEDQALWSGMRDVVRAIMDDSRFNVFFDQARAAADTQIRRPVDATEFLVKEYGIPKSKQNELLTYFSQDSLAGMTQWGLANAVTRLAQDYQDQDTAVGLEETGYKVMVDDRFKQFTVAPVMVPVGIEVN